MKSIKGKIIKKIIFALILFMMLICTNIYAFSAKIEQTEYTDEYKNYLNLSNEEKLKVIEPNKYKTIYSRNNSQYLSKMQNVFKSMNLLSNTLESSYSLLDIIPTNVKVRNQENTNTCWAFASLGALESNLALLDYRNTNQSITYDYSERHLVYGARRNVFNNNQINDYGFTKKIEEGGNFFHAQTYLSNGMGAVKEEEMPFENNSNNIDISEIKNKTISTTLYDTIWLEDIDDVGKDQLVSRMKQIISTYGGIYAGVHGANLISDSYNNNTGAIFCNNSISYPLDHAVTIIGWDDNYSRDNFNEASKPTNDGAWIVKNSWGEEIRTNLLEIKRNLYSQHTSEFNNLDIFSAEEIPNNLVEQIYGDSYGANKVSIDGEELVIEIGNKGYMYISYEDVNIYTNLSAIQKSTNTKDYDNIYQYDKLGAGASVKFSGIGKIYIANKFNRYNTENEVLDKISLFTLQEITCKVYVNPNSDDLSNLQEVELETGNSITLEPGYHVIELKNPINLTGNSFAVATSIEVDGQAINVMVENKSLDENAEINNDESFYTDETGFATGNWFDWNDGEDEGVKGNVSIKAFTKNAEIVPELEKIEITKKPNKTTYIEGENFEKDGMEILATYNDLSTKVISDYEVIDGNNLYLGQNKVTISYTENGITKTADQEITVQAQSIEKEVQSIQIVVKPTKLEYSLNSNEVDLTGGIIRVTYTDNTSDEISMLSSEVEIEGFDGSVAGTQTITVRYKGATDTFEIVVLNKIEPILSNLDNIQTQVNNIRVYLYEELDEEEYMDMTFRVSRIEKGNEETEYTYYYYISGSDSEENISWIKIDNQEIMQNDGTYLLEFDVNTKKLNNYSELIDADRIYLYLREVAEADGTTIEQTKISSIDVEESSNIYYIDNEYVGSIDDVVDNSGGLENPGTNQGGNFSDNTVAEGSIPQTGISPIGIIMIIIIIIIGIIGYIKYKNIYK